MSASLRRSQRDVRKRLLMLEAEMYRLDIAASLGQLRKPVSHLQHFPALLGLFGNKNHLAGALAGLLASGRGAWLVRVIPLALAGWRIAKLLRGLLARRRGSV